MNESRIQSSYMPAEMSSLYRNEKEAKTRYSFFLKAASLGLTVVFFCQQIVFAAPGVIKPIPLTAFDKPPLRLEIPESVAVTEDYFTADKARDASSVPVRPLFGGKREAQTDSTRYASRDTLHEYGNKTI